MATGREQILCKPALQCSQGTLSSRCIRTSSGTNPHLLFVEARYRPGARSWGVGPSGKALPTGRRLNWTTEPDSNSIYAL